MSKILTSGRFKDRKGRSFINKVEKRADYRQVIPKFEVTPEPKRAVERSSLQRENCMRSSATKNDSVPPQASGCYDMIKESVKNAHITQPKSVPKKRVFAQRQLKQTNDARIVPQLPTEKAMRNTSPSPLIPREKFVTSRPQLPR